MEKPTCKTCFRQFSRRDHLKRHYASAHLATAPIVCIHCSKFFTRRDALRRHLLGCAKAVFGSQKLYPNFESLPSESKGRKRRSCDRCVSMKKKCIFDRDNVCSNCSKAGRECTMAANKRSSYGDFQLLGSPLSWPSPPPSTSRTESTTSIATPRSHSTATTSLAGVGAVAVGTYTSTGPLTSTGALVGTLTRTSALVDELWWPTFHFSPLLLPAPCKSPIVEKLDAMTDGLDPKVKQWLHKDNVVQFINNYFSGFHLHTPFLHQPTFDILASLDILLYCLAIVGALYSSNAEDVTTASSLLDSIDSYIRCRVDTTKNVPLDILQAYICMYTAQTWIGTKEQRENAILKFPYLVKMARDQGLVYIRHKLRYERTAKDWEAWMATEKQIRVVYSILLLDTSYLIFFEQAPRLFPAELNIPLPSHHNWWDAASYQDWHDCYEPRPLFLDVIHLLMNSGTLHTRVSLFMYDFFVLLHGLYVNMWIYKQLLNSFSITQVVQQKLALENWRKVWDDYTKKVPSGEWSKFGFCRNAMEYYWLARMFLATREENLTLDFQNPGNVSNKIEEISPEDKGSDEKLLNTLKFMKAVRYSQGDKRMEVKDLLRQIEGVPLGRQDIFEFVLGRTMGPLVQELRVRCEL